MPRFFITVALILATVAATPAMAYTQGDTPALARDIIGPHHCTAMIQTSTDALVVCEFPKTGKKPRRYEAQAVWVKEHFSQQDGVQGLFVSDDPPQTHTAFHQTFH